ncbi:MAG TPA: sensor domain-containing protein [Ilumatobacteraceae bacterium]
MVLGADQRLSVGISMLTVALLGIPILLGVWYATRAFANIERATANVLLDQHLTPEPLNSNEPGNLWVRLRAMTRDRDRQRELGFLMLRFPAGIATFTAATTALATPFLVAYAPFVARFGGDHPFGDWAMSSRLEDIANSSWSWFLIPLGVILLFVSFHAMNALAKACGRWTATSLGPNRAD